MVPQGKERQRRRKISLACEPCRERKSRCDGGKPICSMCRRRALGLERCVYKLENARTASTDEYIKVLHSRIRKLEQVCRDSHVQVPSLDFDLPPIAEAETEADTRQTPTSTPICSDYSFLRLTPTKESSSVDSPLVQSQPPNTAASADNGIVTAEPNSSVSAMGTVITDDDVSVSEDFYGSSSTASFFKEAFDSMKDHKKHQHTQPRREAGRDWRRGSSYFVPSHQFSLPPRDLADHLVATFREKVYYMYPFFHLPSFEAAYRSLWKPQAEPKRPSTSSPTSLGLGCYPDGDANTISFHAALNAIFSLACHYSDLPPAERLAASTTFFLRTKPFVNIDLLEANNLSVVQTLLLIALNLQGTPHPSRCWNASGVACRVAQGLGLHAEHHQDTRGALEKEIRRRTWYGCIVMDMLVSMTYGRPAMTTHISVLPLPSGFEQNLSVPVEPHQVAPRFRFYRENIRLCGILEDILSKVYQPWMNRVSPDLSPVTGGNTSPHYSLDTIVMLHRKLSDFENSVHETLSWKREGEIPSEYAALFKAQRLLLHGRYANQKDSFIYLRIMLLRPILTHLSTHEQPKSVGPKLESTTFTDPILAGTSLQCAKLCVEAAIDLLRLLHTNFNPQVPGSWWWDIDACTAGIVLIIARTCPTLVPSLNQAQMSTAWDECQQILKHVASFNASGRQSLKMLQTIHSKVLVKSGSSPASPNLRPQTTPAAEECDLLQSVAFDSATNFDLSTEPEFQGFGDLDMIGSFFNWDTTSFDAFGGVPIQN
ncbi:Zn(2)-Cys(6) zinc finger domain protein [Metarhizium robertsii]|uniref:Zn(2)-Cys(6) zinc finger domain protein n=1 Tax=Metarhizium robertsii TaxID=568076 RepID=A0A0A1V0S2_9HYPO|nr:Zn(2)-Cys(6) zinc finger domain protein [Metarhizium robertsii]